MKSEITRDAAWALLNKHIKKPELIFHMRETEVIMRALARHLGEDENLWGNTGLLHDLDFEQLPENYVGHGEKTVEILQAEGYDIPEMSQAILAHCEEMSHCTAKRKSKLDFALAAAENISGFIVAVALMRPTKLEGLKAKSVKKKLKTKAFAANVNREMIDDIEQIGQEKNEFIALAIEAVASIKDEIGL